MNPLPPAAIEPVTLCLHCHANLTAAKKVCFVPHSESKNARRTKPFCNGVCAKSWAMVQTTSARFSADWLTELAKKPTNDWYVTSQLRPKKKSAKKRQRVEEQPDGPVEQPAKKARVVEQEVKDKAPDDRAPEPAQIPAHPRPDTVALPVEWMVRYFRPGHNPVDIVNPVNLFEAPKRAGVPTKRFTHFMVAQPSASGVTLYPRMHVSAEHAQYYMDEKLELVALQNQRHLVPDREAVKSLPLASVTAGPAAAASVRGS
jgi:hypothetical protein